MSDINRIAVAGAIMLSFRNVGEAVSRHDVAHRAVCLDARRHAVFLAPFSEWAEEVIQDEFGESQMIVIADVRGERPCVLPQSRQVRGKVVAPASAELLKQTPGPVRAFHFQAVTENGMKGRRVERIQFVKRSVPHRVQEKIQRLAIKVIEDVSFHAGRGPLHLHQRGAVREGHDPPGTRGYLPWLPSVQWDNSRVRDVWLLGGKNGDGNGRKDSGIIREYGAKVPGEIDGAYQVLNDHLEPSSRQIKRNEGAAIRPATPQGEIKLQSQAAGLLKRVAQQVEPLRREIPDVMDTAFGVVDLHGVDGLQLHAFQACVTHHGELARDLFASDGASEPPPSGHGARRGSRIEERGFQCGERTVSGALRMSFLGFGAGGGIAPGGGSKRHADDAGPREELAPGEEPAASAHSLSLFESAVTAGWNGARTRSAAQTPRCEDRQRRPLGRRFRYRARDRSC